MMAAVNGNCFWYMASGDSLVSLAYSYRLGHTTVMNSVHMVCAAIEKTMMERFLSRPTQETWEEVAQGFWRLAQDAPERCTSHFDAVAQIRGEAFFFKGKFFWRLTREKHLVSLRPAQIQRFWRGLPANLDGLDAVYERPGDHKIVFFKGLKYWVFKDNNVEEGYPRPISDFGLPMESVDAAFVWLHNDKTYFFKDMRYWRYDDHLRCMDPGYPKDVTLWNGLPPNLDDAMRWSDGSSYFFKGKEYWRVLASDMEVEVGFPRLIAKDWLLCTEMQSDSPNTDSKTTDHGGQHLPDHAENGYEVCSCTSDMASPLGARASPSTPLWLLPPLWTLLLALGSMPL